ncbi:MAG: hypothetical protein ABI840_10660 [bacterium]
MNQKILLLFFLLVLSSQFSNAQWTNNPSVNTPVCIATGDQINQKMCSDGAAGTIIVWMDFRSGTNYDIYVQHIDSAGVVKWTNNGVIICNNIADNWSPLLISDGAGGAIITWYDGFDAGIIRAQRINSNGIVLWTTNGIIISNSISHHNSLFQPQMISDGNGGAIICWYDARESVDWFIYGQRINSSGQILWQSNGVKLTKRTGFYPMPISDGAGGAIFCFFESYSSGKVFAERINGNGLILWNDSGMIVSNHANIYHEDLLICSDGFGGAIISWYNLVSSNNYDIYSQRINSNGITQWVNNGVLVGGDPQLNIRFLNNNVSDGAGGTIICWPDNRRAGILDVYGQKINSSGNTQWSPNGRLIISSPAGDSRFPRIISDGQGGAIVACESSDLPGINFDIYVQRINFNGETLWNQRGIPASNAPGNQFFPELTSRGNGKAIVSWQLENADLYCSAITSNQINFTGRIQGFYNPITNQSVKDTIRIYIRKGSPPYQVLDSQKVITNENGFVKFFEPYLDAFTPYYIQVKHRNSIETWSNLFNFDNTETVNYNFTSSQSQAYGNNQIQVDNSPFTFAFYNGDVNQDGSIDLADGSLIDNDSYNFVSGYVKTDLTGDNLVDLSDYTIADNNAYNYVVSIRP